MQTDHHMARMTDTQPQDFTGTDLDGTSYLLVAWPDGHRTLAVRPLGARTWGPPVELEAAS